MKIIIDINDIKVRDSKLEKKIFKYIKTSLLFVN